MMTSQNVRTLLQLSVLVSLAALSASCGLTGVAGNGKPHSESRQVSGFTQIDVEGAFDVEVVQGAEFSLKLRGDENLVPLVRTKVTGSVLELDTSKNVRPKLPLVVQVTLPAVSALHISGSSTIRMQELTSESLAADISGSGEITVAGAVNDLKISISGSGSFEGKSLRAEKAIADISGSGQAKIFASTSLQADISGSGHITYWGNPADVKSNVSGSGEIEAGK